MLSAPELVDTKAEQAAVIRLNIARSEMPKQFPLAVRELMAALAAQKVEPIGRVFAHHLKMSADTFDFELGVRTASAVSSTGRVQPGELPGAKVVRAIYSGPYEGLHSAWAELNQWMDEKGYKRANHLWEVYSVGPESTADPSGWRTELNRPILE